MDPRCRKVTTPADVDRLFAEYVRDGLPQQGPALANLRAWLDAGERVALTYGGAAATDL